MLAKAICRDLEDVMSLTGSREWRDTDDPYMDAVCDTIVDYMKNDIKEFLDPEYIKELLKHCVVRVISLYATALLTPSRKKCSINDKFFSRLQLGKQILYDFGMEYVTFEKVCSFILKGILPNAPQFVNDSLSIIDCIHHLYRGTAAEMLEAIRDLHNYDVSCEIV